jgi:hypothetical protein
VPGILYNIVMKMMMLTKIGDLQITAIPSCDRGLIFFTVTNADCGWRKLHNEELHDVHSYTKYHTETNNTKFASKTKYPQFAHRIKARLMSNNKSHTHTHTHIYIYTSI